MDPLIAVGLGYHRLLQSTDDLVAGGLDSVVSGETVPPGYLDSVSSDFLNFIFIRRVSHSHTLALADTFLPFHL